MILFYYYSFGYLSRGSLPSISAIDLSIGAISVLTFGLFLISLFETRVLSDIYNDSEEVDDSIEDLFEAIDVALNNSQSGSRQEQYSNHCIRI